MTFTSLLAPLAGRLVILATSLLIGLVAVSAKGQVNPATSVYDVSLRHVPIQEALARFSEITATGVSYDPLQVEGRMIYCVIESAPIDDVLRCILQDTNLSFARLSSGTYVIMRSKPAAPQRGSLLGVVSDKRTGRPLPNAHVMLASNTLDLGVITNDRGQFTLPPLLPGEYVMLTSHLGYTLQLDTLLVHPGEDRFQRIELESEPIAITPIVIDGAHIRRASLDLARTVLRGDVLQLGTVHTSAEPVFQRFQAVPGLRVNDITADAHLQGSNAGEHQFRLDGVPVFLPHSTLGLIGPFSPFAIQTVTVHKSGFGAEEGSQLAGVIEASHFLDTATSFDVQVDLTALNGRASLNETLPGNRQLKLMAAGRTSLWSLYQQDPFQQTLNAWSKPDPFLIFGATQQYSAVAPAFFQETLNVNAVPSTDLAFADIHVAGALNTSALSGFHSSFYRGRNRFDGSLLPDVISFNAARLDNEDELGVPVGDPSPVEVPAELSLVDTYEWTNTTGQLQYHTVFGPRTLFNVQAKTSAYTLDQNYLLIDSLEQYTDDFPRTDTEFVSQVAVDLPTRPVDDTNSIASYSLESQVDHVAGRHSFLLGAELTYLRSRFDVLLTNLPDPDLNVAAAPERFEVSKDRVGYESNVTRQALFARDRIRLSRRIELEGSIRLTYLPNRKTLYAEPRFALRYDAFLSERSTLGIQTSGGLYRQYLLQLDVSTLNAGSLFPSKRIWLPINGDIRPPMAFHLTQSLFYSPFPSLSFHIEGYLKLQQRLWFLSYFSQERVDSAVDPAGLLAIRDLRDLLSEGDGKTYGASLSARWSADPFRVEAVYDHTAVERRSNELFNGNRFSAPWEEPHRLYTQLSLKIKNRFLLTQRFTAIWGRSWGFRQAYYDFFGHSLRIPNPASYSFDTPDAHVLPAFYQVDLGFVYSQPVGTATVQLRLDLLNVLDRQNVADWRLVWQDEQGLRNARLRIQELLRGNESTGLQRFFAGGRLVKEARYHYPFIPAIALRVTW